MGRKPFFLFLCSLLSVENAGRIFTVTSGRRTVRSPCQIITKYCTIDCGCGYLALEIPIGSMQRVYY